MFQHHHDSSHKVPLLPLQIELEGAPHSLAVDYDLPLSPLSKHHWGSSPWVSRLGDFADRSSSSLVPSLVGLPLLVSIFAHIYFRMFSTLHIFLALVWIGLPVATISTLVAVALKSYHSGNTRREHFRALVLITLLCTVVWSTLTVSPRWDVTLSSSSDFSANNETVFITANLYNSEHLFPAFSDSLLELVHHLGESNVFVSIYESNSQDRTKQLLSSLERDLHLHGVQNSIRMLDNSRRHDMSRIERLAIIRNEALSPIQAGIHGLHGRNFSKLVWLNDIFFRPESVLELLSTNAGHYDQVCALDYFPLGFYDT